jgi:hypothetical protein
MKTSDPAAYTYIEQITPSANTILSIRGLLITNNASGTITISGTSWEQNSSGYKTVTFAVNFNTSAQLNLILPLSLRTITSISAGTVYGLR